jgi:hypothetical protein
VNGVSIHCIDYRVDVAPCLVHDKFDQLVADCDMKFEQVDDTTVLIKRAENAIAGSIGRVGDHHWHVEILWSGPTGDIVYDAPSLPAAMAFIAGVEKAMEAVAAS